MDNYFEEDVPTKRKHVLDKLRNRKVVKLVRYSMDEPESMAQYYSLAPQDVFSLTEGPLLLYLDSGLIAGFESRDYLASVTVWIECTEKGDVDEEAPLLDDPDFFQIDASNRKYTDENITSLINTQITSLSLIKRLPRNTKYESLPNEAGLIVHFEDRSELILSHNLHGDTGNFSVITRDKIPSNILSELQEFPL